MILLVLSLLISTPAEASEKVYSEAEVKYLIRLTENLTRKSCIDKGFKMSLIETAKGDVYIALLSTGEMFRTNPEYAPILKWLLERRHQKREEQ